jgi:anaerobic glycerol-3-phosphate dehydrogenase
VIYENVFAVGGLLAGADRNSEGSREGIDLATAWAAVRNYK